MASDHMVEQTNPGTRPARGHGALLAMAALVVVVAGLRAGRPLFVPFVLAVFLSAMGVPVIGYLRKRRFPDWLSVALVMVMLTLAVGLLIFVLATTTRGFADKVPWYQQRLTQLVVGWAERLDALGVPLSVDRVTKMVDPGAVMGLVGGMVKGLLAALSNALLVLLTVIFILAEAALNMVRMALAVRPCFPMTFPKSSLSSFPSDLTTTSSILRRSPLFMAINSPLTGETNLTSGRFLS